MSSPLLLALHAALPTDGSILIDATLPGCAAIVAEIDAVLGVPLFWITDAAVSAPDANGNFSVAGHATLFGPALAVEAAVFVADTPEALQMVLTVHDPLAAWSLPSLFAIPVLGSPPLATATVAFVSSGFAAPGSTYRGALAFAGDALGPGLNFAGTLDISGDPWAVLRAILPRLSAPTIVGTIAAPSGTTPMLRLLHRFDAASPPAYRITSSLALKLNALRLNCALGGFEIPRLSFEGDADGAPFPLALTLSTALGDGRIGVSGAFADGRAATLSQIADMLGLGGDVLNSALPSPYGEQVFGALALRDLDIELSGVPPGVARVQCTLTAQRPWTVLRDLFSLSGDGSDFLVTPLLQFDVDSSVTPRDVRVHLAGLFTIGATRFVLSTHFPGGAVAGRMIEGDTLDVGALFHRCLPNVPQPCIDLTDLSFDANWTAGRISFSIEASGIWPLDIGIGTLALAPRVFVASCRKGRVEAWGFGGSITFAGLSFDITGDYDQAHDWTLRALKLGGNGLDFGGLYNQVVAEFPKLQGPGLPGTVPDAFSHCGVSAVSFEYAHETKRLSLYADIVSAFDLGGLSVDEVAVNIVFEDQKPTTGNGLARIRLGGLDIQLSATQEVKDWRFEGRSDDNELIDLSDLMESLANLADITIPLPAQNLLVGDLSIKFNFGAPCVFTCSCMLKTKSDQGPVNWGTLSFSARKGTEVAGWEQVKLSLEADAKLQPKDADTAPHAGFGIIDLANQIGLHLPDNVKKIDVRVTALTVDYDAAMPAEKTDALPPPLSSAPAT